jgi:hypothetical protein
MIRALIPLLVLGSAPAAAAVADMAGTWTVDLRPSLADKPYSQPMQLKIAADGMVSGSFYNSEILAGRSVSARGRDCVAFRTTDGSGFYHSAACLEGGRMVGTTWAEGRNFLFPWTAER